MDYSATVLTLFRSPEFREAIEEVALVNLDVTEDEELASHAIAFAASLHVESPVLVLCRGYQALYTFLTLDAVESAEAGLRDLLAIPAFRGAAASLLFLTGRWRGAPSTELANLARTALEAEPQWVMPHILMADSLREGGDLEGSVTQLEMAKELCLPAEHVAALSPKERAFEEHFTGRTSSLEMLQELIDSTRKRSHVRGRRGAAWPFRMCGGR